MAKNLVDKLKNTYASFRKTFFVSGHHNSYIPPPRQRPDYDPEAFRTPSPASQDPAEIPDSKPEHNYDVAYFKRSTISSYLTPGDERKDIRPFPSQIPTPTWFYRQEEVAAKFKAQGWLFPPLGELYNTKTHRAELNKVWLDPQVSITSEAERKYEAGLKARDNKLSQ